MSSGGATGPTAQPVPPGLALEAVDLLDHRENDERQDEEIDGHGDEVAVGKDRYPAFFTASSVIAVPSGTLPSAMNMFEKSSLPNTSPTTGMMRSETTESTILPKRRQ